MRDVRQVRAHALLTHWYWYDLLRALWVRTLHTKVTQK